MTTSFRMSPRLGALLLGAMLGLAQAAPVALRAALSGEDAPAVPATVTLLGDRGEQTVMLPEGGAVLDLPPGEFRVTVAGGATLLTPSFTVTERGADVTLRVQPDVTVRAQLPATAAPGETVTARVTLSSAYGAPLTLTPELSLSPGLLLLRRVNLTRTLAPGQTVTLEVPLLVGAAEDLGLSVNIRGLNARADATLLGRAPARAQVDLEDPEAADDAGAAIRTAGRTLTVRNVGGEDGVFPVQVQAQGVRDARVMRGGQPLGGATLGVAAGQEVRLDLAGEATGPGAQLTVTVGGVPTRVPLAAPDAPLLGTLSVTPADPLPGETVTVTLRLDNRSGAPVSGPLRVQAPTWLTLDGPPGDSVTVPEGTSELSWTARVPFGPADRGLVSVEGSGPLAALRDARPVTRTLLAVQAGVDPDVAAAGSDGLLPLLVRNPTGRPVTVRLQVDAQAPADSGLPAELDLEPHAAAVTNVSVQSPEAGTVSVTVTPLIAGVVAGAPQPGGVTFAAVTQAQRRSTLRLPFDIRGLTTGRVLAAHLPPEGARFVPGSATALLDTRRVALPDPRVGDDGRLHWTLPEGVRQGALVYDVLHSDALDAPPPLDLTARVGERDLPLAGQLRSEDAARAAPLQVSERDGLIRFPRDGTVLPDGGRSDVTLEGPAGVPVRLTVNGEEVPDERIGEAGRAFDRERRVYVGLPMQVGVNVIEVRYGALSDRVQVVVPGAATQLDLSLDGSTVADGSRPVALLVRSLDAQGRPSGEGQVTLSTSLEPLDPDADPGAPGYQVNLRGGVARVRLEAVSSAQTLEAEALLGQLRARAALFVPVPQLTSASYQASAGLTYSARGGLRAQLSARGYAEFPAWQGQMQVVADTGQLPGLDSAATAARRYALTGSGTEPRSALSSDLGFAFRFERQELSAGYFAGPLNLPGLNSLPTASALRVTTHGQGVSLFAVAARVPGGTVTDTFGPDGGRRFTLRARPLVGTERVVLRGATDQVLTAGRDYTLDPVTGDLTLARTPSLFGPNFERQTLVVTYSAVGEAGVRLGAGVGASVQRGGWTLGGSVAVLGTQPAFGVQARYVRPGTEFGVAFTRGPDSPEGRLSVAGSVQRGPLSGSLSVGGSGDLRVTLAGAAELAYRPGPFGVKLSGRVQEGGLWTAAQGEWRPAEGVTLSAGPEVRWGAQGTALNALLGVSVTRGNVSADLSHAQPLLGGDDPLTRLGVSYALSATTAVTARVQRGGPDGALSGEVGVSQKLGTSNLNVTYQLPGVSGQSSRARFGVNTPLVFSPNLSATLSASLLRDLDRGVNTAGAGFTVNYRRAGLSGTLGVDGTRGEGGARVTVRGGVSGTVKTHVLSVDGSLQVRPELGGQLNVSHAWRSDRAALLQYHRFSSLGADPTLEGEVALHVDLPRAGGRPGLTLQPSVAYQLPTRRREDLTGQLGLSVTVPLDGRFSVGVSGFLIGQPGREQYAATLGADVRVRVNENLRVVGGYTLNVAGADLAGLTPGAGGGFFVRADLFGGR